MCWIVKLTLVLWWHLSVCSMSSVAMCVGLSNCLHCHKRHVITSVLHRYAVTCDDAVIELYLNILYIQLM